MMIASALKKPHPSKHLIERKFMRVTSLESRNGTTKFLYCLTHVLLCGNFICMKSAAAEPSPAVNAINTLGIDLLHKVGKPDANVLLSPYSIQSALAMAYAGAEGTTRDEMATV